MQYSKHTGRHTPIPITLLTGFLGSGKTTILNQLVKAPSMAGTAVIVNEFGDIGLDHELVCEASEAIVLLRSGCLCCSIRTDLIETLYDLLERHLGGEIATLEHVIVETTGLADPAPIAHTLLTDQMLASQFALDAIIATVDAAVGMETLEAQPESVKQVAIADRILLTKTDLADSARIDTTKARIRAINPGASIVRVHNGEIDPAVLAGIATFETAGDTESVRGWLNLSAYDSPYDHAGNVNSVCLMLDEPLPLAVLDLWLDTLATRQDPDLLRMKGLINVQGRDLPLLVHGVQHVFHPPRELSAWPTADHRSRIVLIARNLREDDLQSCLDFLRSAAKGGGKGLLALSGRRKRDIALPWRP